MMKFLLDNSVIKETIEQINVFGIVCYVLQPPS